MSFELTEEETYEMAEEHKKQILIDELAKDLKELYQGLPRFSNSTEEAQPRLGSLHQYIGIDNRQALSEALDGTRGEVQGRLALEGMRLTAMLLRKNSDYGSSAYQVPILAPHLDARSAILVRMSDKIHRIANLSKPGSTPEVTESLNDTIRDLAGYCILLLAYQG